MSPYSILGPGWADRCSVGTPLGDINYLTLPSTTSQRTRETRVLVQWVNAVVELTQMTLLRVITSAEFEHISCGSPEKQGLSARSAPDSFVPRRLVFSRSARSGLHPKG